MEKLQSGNLPSRSASKSPSWIAERDALRLFGDRKTRAVLAIFHARRSAKMTEFFVHPDIAKVNRLTPGQLNWALDRLEGSLIETVQSKNGKYRTIKLLPQIEKDMAVPRGCVAAGEERVLISTEEVLAGLQQARTERTGSSQTICNEEA